MPCGSLSETRLMDEYAPTGATGPRPATNPYSDCSDHAGGELAGRLSPDACLEFGQPRRN
jgi:hypothetical protein